MPKNDHLSPVRADGEKLKPTNSDSHSKCRPDGKHVDLKRLDDHLTPVVGDKLRGVADKDRKHAVTRTHPGDDFAKAPKPKKSAKLDEYEAADVNEE